MLKGYITNLGKYDEGRLIGEWITFPIDEDQLQATFERIGISDEPDENGIYYEEYFFTDWDWECDFSVNLGEYISIDEVNELAESLDYADAEALAAYMEAVSNDLIEALDNIDSCVFYPGQTLEDVAYDIVNECYDLPEIAQRYFDYKAFARDLGFDGYYETSCGVLYVS